MRKQLKLLVLRSSFCLLLLALPGAALSQDQSPAWSLELTVESGRGDAEEFLEGSHDDSQRWPQGYTYTVSSDLELGSDPQHGPQLVGLRFEDVDIPKGARIQEALLEFGADSDQASELLVTIAAEAASSPAPFEQDPDGVGGSGLSSRETGTARVSWSPAPWTVGETYRSPDIASLLQESVDRDDWEGDALVLLIAPETSGGGGFRSAVSSDEEPHSAPRLLVRFTPPAADDGGVAPLRAPLVEPPGGRALTPEAGGATDRVEPERPAGDQGRPETADEPGEAAEPVMEQPAAARPDDPRRMRFELRSNHARGVSGSVLLSDHGLGVTAITLFLEGVAPGAEYPVSIHRGDCGESSMSVLDLEPMSASRPFSTTIVPKEFDELVSGDLHLNVYRITDEFTRIAGCARLGG